MPGGQTRWQRPSSADITFAICGQALRSRTLARFARNLVTFSSLGREMPWGARPLARRGPEEMLRSLDPRRFAEFDNVRQQFAFDVLLVAEVCDPSTKVIIIGRYNDIPLYRDLIRNGISEYIVAPVAMADMHECHRGDLRRSGSRTARPQHRLHRRQGRRRLLDARAQLRLGHLQPVFDRSRACRSRPALWHGQYQFRPGSAAGHLRSRVFARSGSTKSFSTVF